MSMGFNMEEKWEWEEELLNVRDPRSVSLGKLDSEFIECCLESVRELESAVELAKDRAVEADIDLALGIDTIQVRLNHYLVEELEKHAVLVETDLNQLICDILDEYAEQYRY